MTKMVAIVIAVLVVAGAYVTVKVLSNRKESDKPLVSLVCLLREHRQITEAEVRSSAAEAFNVTLAANNPDATQFVLELAAPPMKGVAEGKAKSFMIKVNQGVFMVNNFAIPYMERPDAFAAGIRDKRLRGAISSHRAWISVDAMGDVIGEKNKVDAYRAIGKMVAALLGLVGNDCLAIYSPELQRCNEYDQVLLDKLQSNDPLSLFVEPTFAPIINVDGDDPRMVKAVAEARRRWPEFVSAFQSKDLRYNNYSNLV